MAINTKKVYCAGINTDRGLIVLELDPSLAPNTVNNFVFLAQHQYFDGMVFHRVVPGFVIQTGDPTAKGTGGPGYKFNDEPVKGSYTKGCVAMANSGANTNGSQFFICTGNDTSLPKSYNLFGHVVQGIDVASKIKGPGDTAASAKLNRMLSITSLWLRHHNRKDCLMAAKRNAPPQMVIDPTKKYVATFHTGAGDFQVELFAAQAPVTVNNFVFLAREGFYSDTTFHRVIPGFMAQGGDPLGTGTGGPGYKLNDERGALSLKHDGAGVLSMANAGPNTNGSQFFITYGPTPHLNGKHGVFGKVVSGMDHVLAIQERDPQRSREPGTPLYSIDITES